MEVIIGMIIGIVITVVSPDAYRHVRRVLGLEPISEDDQKASDGSEGKVEYDDERDARGEENGGSWPDHPPLHYNGTPSVEQVRPYWDKIHKLFEHLIERTPDSVTWKSCQRSLFEKGFKYHGSSGTVIVDQPPSSDDDPRFRYHLFDEGGKMLIRRQAVKPGDYDYEAVSRLYETASDHWNAEFQQTLDGMLESLDES